MDCEQCGRETPIQDNTAKGLCPECDPDRLTKDKQVGKLQAEVDALKKPCKWKYDDIDDMWDTECGESYCLTFGGLKDNGTKFCPYCGGKILPEAEGPALSKPVLSEVEVVEGKGG